MAEWFASWFDSPYYHVLYENRDHTEAQCFLENFAAKQGWPKTHQILDLACGAGRHSTTLAQLGYEVVGVDLSPASIQEAKNLNQPGAQFEVADMRTFSLDGKFDVVLNLFTSFGYFDHTNDNALVLSRVHSHLKSNGKLVIDFLNPARVKARLIEEEVIKKQGIDFDIRREINDTHVIKHIGFEIDGREHRYREQVQLFSPSDFDKMLTEAGFFIENVLGSYQLDDFSALSERQIIIARRE
jgi:SAM-dependent methyltransferase